jgi:hypothetical protein
MCKGYGTCECGVTCVVSESFAGGNTDQNKLAEVSQKSEENYKSAIDRVKVSITS